MIYNMLVLFFLIFCILYICLVILLLRYVVYFSCFMGTKIVLFDYKTIIIANTVSYIEQRPMKENQIPIISISCLSSLFLFNANGCLPSAQISTFSLYRWIISYSSSMEGYPADVYDIAIIDC